MRRQVHTNKENLSIFRCSTQTCTSLKKVEFKINFVLDFKLNPSKSSSVKDRYLWKHSSPGKIRPRFCDQERITLLHKGRVKQKPTKPHVSRWKDNSYGQTEAFDTTTEVDLLRTTIRAKEKRPKWKLKKELNKLITWGSSDKVFYG